MTTTTTDTGRRSKRLGNCNGKPNSKRRKLETQGPNWSNLPRDIIECLLERLLWVDRIRIRTICKAWSVPNLCLNTPAIDKIPWAFQIFSWDPIDKNKICGECRLFDPLSREYIVLEKEGSVREKECRVILDPDSVREKEYRVILVTNFLASAYGWVLFEKQVDEFETETLIFLYSPFTNEFIMLPDLGDLKKYQVYALSLNATSPKCVIFALGLDSDSRYVHIMLYSVGDDSPKTFKLKSIVQSDRVNVAVSAVYANGVFYCVFANGELGAFDVELEEWRMLTNYRPPAFASSHSKLIAFDPNLWVWSQTRKKLFRFDFSEMRWVYENNLNNHVLFIGVTSFAAPAVRETSRLANTIFSCHPADRGVICYGSKPRRGRKSLLYHQCKGASERARGWIEPPSGGIWRVNDLRNAV